MFREQAPEVFKKSLGDFIEFLLRVEFWKLAIPQRVQFKDWVDDIRACDRPHEGGPYLMKLIRTLMLAQQ